MATRPASPATRPQEGGTVLQLEGVDVPVRARVLGRSESRVTVEQALPFLRLDSQVLEGADRAARIRRVTVGFEHGVPRLIMELSYDRRRTDDATVPYELDASHHRPSQRQDEAKAGAQTMASESRMRQRTLAFRLPGPVPDSVPSGCPSLLRVLRRAVSPLVGWLAYVGWLLRRLKPKRV